MTGKSFVKKPFLIMWICIVSILSSSDVFAWDGYRPLRPRYEVVVVGHERYHYREGRFYRPGWLGIDFAIVSPPVGAVVTFLPAGYSTIVIGGATYYYYGNVYYRGYPSGYIVVPSPAAVSNVVPVNPVRPDQAYSGKTVIINVPNANGTYTPVTLIKHNNGYIGPQGEYYEGHLSVNQLRFLYGK